MVDNGSLPTSDLDWTRDVLGLTELSQVVYVICMVLLVLNVILGVYGNILMCIAVGHSKTLRTSVNALVVNLAAADLVVSTFCVPFLIYCLGTEQKSICTETSAFINGVQEFSRVTGGSVQLISIIGISIERHQAIAKPFEKIQRSKRIKMTIVISWCVGVFNGILSVTLLSCFPSIQECTQIVLIHSVFFYQFGMYIFVPFSFLSVVIVLVFYIKLLYLIRIHVKNNSIFKRRNKIGPLAEENITPDSNDEKTKKAKKSAMLNPTLEADLTIITNISKENLSVMNVNEHSPQNSANKSNYTNVPHAELYQKVQETKGTHHEMLHKERSKDTLKKDEEITQYDNATMVDGGKTISNGMANENKTESNIKTDAFQDPNNICDVNIQLPPNKTISSTENKERKDIEKSVKNNVEFNSQVNNVQHIAPTVYLDPSSSSDIIESHAATSTRGNDLNHAVTLQIPGHCHYDQVEDEKALGGSSSSSNSEAIGTNDSLINFLPVPKDKVIDICNMDGSRVKAKTSRSDICGDICVMNPVNKEMGKRKLEARTAKKTAIIVTTFLGCWLPFPVIIVAGNFLDSHDHATMETMNDLYMLALSLATLAAALNPIIYGLINKQFRHEFLILWKKCMGCKQDS